MPSSLPGHLWPWSSQWSPAICSHSPSSTSSSSLGFLRPGSLSSCTSDRQFSYFQAFYFIMKSLEGDLYGKYHTTWVALFHMTLGEYEVGLGQFWRWRNHFPQISQYDDFDASPYPAMAKTVFVLFQILIPILLLNMLIAMMGNTYAIVIEKSEKEFLKQVSWWSISYKLWDIHVFQNRFSFR